MFNAILGSASETLDIGRILLDLTIILIVAKVAAEISDRIHVPAVIGEITAGILIGPSVVGLVNTSDMLSFLAELGVIMLLIQVGLETDIVELKSVGRASILVAIIGVALPMALGFGASSMLGESINTSLFVGAALTATSIGITARVFGDLRALATVEARTVLGAAVVDDVLGLIILRWSLALSNKALWASAPLHPPLVSHLVFLQSRAQLVSLSFRNSLLASQNLRVRLQRCR